MLVPGKLIPLLYPPPIQGFVSPVIRSGHLHFNQEYIIEMQFNRNGRHSFDFRARHQLVCSASMQPFEMRHALTELHRLSLTSTMVFLSNRLSFHPKRLVQTTELEVACEKHRHRRRHGTGQRPITNPFRSCESISTSLSSPSINRSDV